MDLLHNVIFQSLKEANYISLHCMYHMDSPNAMISFMSRISKLQEGLKTLIPDVYNKHTIAQVPQYTRPSANDWNESKDFINNHLDFCLNLVDKNDYPDLYKKLTSLRKSKFLN